MLFAELMSLASFVVLFCVLLCRLLRLLLVKMLAIRSSTRQYKLKLE